MLASSQSWDPHDPFLDCLSEDRKKLSCQCKVRLVQNSESRREEGIIGFFSRFRGESLKVEVNGI